MQVEREALCGLIPHSGQMCLLDYVERWGDDWIVCGSNSHQRTDNPLRRKNILSVVHAAEYGAQAMAVHGGLLQQRQGMKMHPGYLAALKEVSFYVTRLDDIKGNLRVRATRLIESESSLMYEFDISINETKVLSARATVMIKGGE